MASSAKEANIHWFASNASLHVGSVAGTNIKQLRETSGAKISISEPSGQGPGAEQAGPYRAGSLRNVADQHEVLQVVSMAGSRAALEHLVRAEVRLHAILAMGLDINHKLPDGRCFAQDNHGRGEQTGDQLLLFCLFPQVLKRILNSPCYGSVRCSMYQASHAGTCIKAMFEETLSHYTVLVHTF